MPATQSPIAAPPPAFEALPFTFVEKASRGAAAVMLLLLLPVLAMIVVPVVLIVGLDAEELRNAFGQKPLAAGMLVAGLMAWAGLFVLPAHRIIRRFWATHSVRIAGDHVTVTEAGLISAKLWTAPLSEFSGIAHNVRATLSGIRHELVLVHRDRRFSVLLHAADRISQQTIDRAALLLELPQLPARELYRVTRSPIPVAVASFAKEQAA